MTVWCRLLTDVSEVESGIEEGEVEEKREKDFLRGRREERREDASFLSLRIGLIFVSNHFLIKRFSILFPPSVHEITSPSLSPKTVSLSLDPCDGKRTPTSPPST